MVLCLVIRLFLSIGSHTLYVNTFLSSLIIDSCAGFGTLPSGSNRSTMVVIIVEFSSISVLSLSEGKSVLLFIVNVSDVFDVVGVGIVVAVDVSGRVTFFKILRFCGEGLDWGPLVGPLK